MKAVSKIAFLDEDGSKFFGEGPCRLLHGVEETGSLRAAAMSMGMAYSKAMKLIRQAENALGFPLTIRAVGGKDGGGSTLTPEGARWLQKYETYRDACIEAEQKIFREMFPRTGCVIMASGAGKRFGSNKLMADFCGRPMILQALEATQGLFDKRIVVTRHESVAELCRAHSVEVLLHDLPHRSDTVRLGLEALGDVDCCLFCSGDQPLLRRESVAGLLDSWEQDRDAIWRLEYGGTPGNPVLFPQWAFPELRTLPEGKGGRYVLQKYPDRICYISAASQWELMDADTPEAMEHLQQCPDGKYLTDYRRDRRTME